jgi:hypothetical protein
VVDGEVEDGDLGVPAGLEGGVEGGLVVVVGDVVLVGEEDLEGGGVGAGPGIDGGLPGAVPAGLAVLVGVDELLRVGEGDVDLRPVVGLGVLELVGVGVRSGGAPLVAEDGHRIAWAGEGGFDLDDDVLALEEPVVIACDLDDLGLVLGRGVSGDDEGPQEDHPEGERQGERGADVGNTSPTGACGGASGCP